MSTMKLNFGEECKNSSPETKDTFASDLGAVAQIFADRMDRNNPVDAFLFSFDKIKQLVDKVFTHNQTATDETKIDFIRIWKGASKTYDVNVECNVNNHTFPAGEKYHEDLVIMPVLKNGDDLYFANDSPKLEDGRFLILHSPRPCPEWCGSRDKNGKFEFVKLVNNYFPLRDGMSKTPMYQGDQPISPYRQYC